MGRYFPPKAAPAGSARYDEHGVTFRRPRHINRHAAERCSDQAKVDRQLPIPFANPSGNPDYRKSGD
jgi:hypothetical protein